MERRIYYIPNNYLDSGSVLNGRFSMRNAAEAVIFGFAGYMLCEMLPIAHGLDNISTYVFVCGPLVMLGAVGINEEPVSQFVSKMYKWRKRRKPCFYNGNGRAYHHTAADLLIDEPSLRDLIADKVQKIRASLRAPTVEYVEGENYQFSSDPELEALDAAEDRLMQQMEEAAAAQEEAPHSVSASALNLDELIHHIVLEDVEED